MITSANTCIVWFPLTPAVLHFDIPSIKQKMASESWPIPPHPSSSLFQFCSPKTQHQVLGYPEYSVTCHVDLAHCFFYIFVFLSREGVSRGGVCGGDVIGPCFCVLYTALSVLHHSLQDSLLKTT